MPIIRPKNHTHPRWSDRLRDSGTRYNLVPDYATLILGKFEPGAEAVWLKCTGDLSTEIFAVIVTTPSNHIWACCVRWPTTLRCAKRQSTKEHHDKTHTKLYRLCHYRDKLKSCCWFSLMRFTRELQVSVVTVPVFRSVTFAIQLRCKNARSNNTWSPVQIMTYVSLMCLLIIITVS